MTRARITALALAAAACLQPAPAPGPVLVSDGRVVMGTVLQISLYARDRASGARTLERLFRRAAELDAVFSHFDPASDLSALNAAAGEQARRVDPDLARILARSVALSRRTGGAFDVTIEPLIELWTLAARADREPTAERLAAALARVGPERLNVDAARGEAALASGSRVNLGAIAKGYTLDVLAELLGNAPMSAALFDFGGSSLHAIGAPPGHNGWRVVVHDPADAFAGVIVLRDRALSVSSAFGETTHIAGRRHGHVIDARTGIPIASARLAAVVARSGTVAEALSTAFLVLDEDERASALRARPRAESLVLDAAGGATTSAGWIDETRFEPLRPS